MPAESEEVGDEAVRMLVVNDGLELTAERKKVPEEPAELEADRVTSAVEDWVSLMKTLLEVPPEALAVIVVALVSMLAPAVPIEPPADMLSVSVEMLLEPLFSVGMVIVPVEERLTEE